VLPLVQIPECRRRPYLAPSSTSGIRPFSKVSPELGLGMAEDILYQGAHRKPA
jgi:hypothetical protein